MDIVSLMREQDGDDLAHITEDFEKGNFTIMEELTLEALAARIIALEERIEGLEQEVNRCAGESHYHDEYASARTVERMERSINDHDRRIDNAQYAADEAKREVERHSSDYYKHGNR